MVIITLSSSGHMEEMQGGEFMELCENVAEKFGMIGGPPVRREDRVE